MARRAADTRTPDRLFDDQQTPYTRFARVVLERGIDQPDGLTYAVPDHLPVAPGDRVEAPLGRGDRPARGIVVEITEASDLDPARIKPLLALRGPRLPATLIDLARWMSAYYCCPLGMVLATMIPAAVKRQVGRVRKTMLTPTGAEPAQQLPPQTRKAWEALRALDADAFPGEARALATRLGLPSVGPLNRLLKLGLLREVTVTTVRAPWQEYAQEPDRGLELVPAQRRAVEAVVGALGTPSPFLLYGVTGSGKTEVYLRIIDAVLARGSSAIVLVPEISLTPQAAGRFIGRFGPEMVAVLHSGLTASQRHQQWARVAAGEARLVIGARSAVFAPFPPRSDAGGPEGREGVGVIVVDEEHDGSYKQDQLPRYHARNVALKRGQLEGCPVVLGSATPSLESWRNATGAGPGAANGAGGGGGGAVGGAGGGARFALLELPERVGGGALPRVEIVDMVEERRERSEDAGRIHSLGPRLERALGETLASGGQAILMLNRRGYASYIHCPGCGWVMQCDHCDVTMVFHRRIESRLTGGGYVRCHHCLAEQKLPEACPVSGGRLSLFGAGTQRLEEELERKYPSLVMGDTMLRLDSDTMNHARDYFDALERFGRGDARVLLGTQMIAKGLDYPNVQLIGVVNGDTAINLPDFRASERTFQLIAQVAGRAGRSAESARARVIVQTLNPTDPAIVAASRHDYRGFAAQELEMRALAGLPPIGRMVRIVFRDRDFDRADAAAREVFRAAQSLGVRHVRVRPPAACAISRIGDYHRVALDLLSDTPGPLQSVLTRLRNIGLVKSDARTAVDVDPVALL